MDDELRASILREQNARGKAILESQRGQIRTLKFDRPIVVGQLWNLILPKGFSSVAEMLNNTACTVAVSIENDFYKRYIAKPNNWDKNRKYLEMDKSKLFLDNIDPNIISSNRSRLSCWKKKLLSKRDFLNHSEKSEFEQRDQELKAKEEEIRTIHKHMSLKLFTEYGFLILKVDDNNEDAFFAIYFKEWDNDVPTIKYWPQVEAEWESGSGRGNTLAKDVIMEILRFHSDEKEGEDSWNVGRSPFQILIQIIEHLNDERAYFENPQKLERTNARYRRCIANNGGINSAQNSFDRYCLELTEKYPNEYFMKEGNTFTIKNATNPDVWYRIDRFSDDENLISTSDKFKFPADLPEEGMLIKAPDTYQNKVKRNTMLKLTNKDRPPKLQPLVTLVTNPKRLSPFKDIEIDFIDPNLRELTETNKSQRESVVKAMSTSDVSLIKGPPGTGKTTVICELSQQLIRRGLKVLVVAPTHVAVDNVLEKIGTKPGIYPIRWGSTYKIDDNLRGYSLSIQKGELTKKIISEYEKKLKNQRNARARKDEIFKLQKEWIEDLKRPKKHGTDEDVIESLLKSQANLVCSTTIGIVGGGLLKRDTIPFDVMIIDEASKSTISEFLVPASYARKWILVGDEKQLSPYVEKEKIDEMIALMLYNHARRQEWGAKRLLLPRNKNDESVKYSDFYWIPKELQEIIRSYAKNVAWRIQSYFQLRFSEGASRGRIRDEIFMQITNLKWNLEYQRNVVDYQDNYRKWKAEVESLNEKYRIRKNKHRNACESETRRAKKEENAYRHRQKEIENHPMRLQKLRKEHEKRIANAKEIFLKDESQRHGKYQKNLAKYNDALENFKSNPKSFTKPKKLKPFKAGKFTEEKFLAPDEPKPLSRPKPPVFLPDPKKPSFPEKPIEPREPKYLHNTARDKHDFIKDNENHLWKALQTITEFEFNSGFELILDSLSEKSDKSKYNFIENNDRISQLEYQFRMHPDIADFNSNVVYDGMYRSAPVTEKRGVSLNFHNRVLKEAILFLDTSKIQPYCKEKQEKGRNGKLKQGRYYNDAEARVIGQMVQELENDIKEGKLQHSDKDKIWDIGVITFYAAQARRIMKELDKNHKKLNKRTFDLADGKGTLQVSIVDRFQGREKDIILLSFTRSNEKRIQGFLKVLNRMNVATTRARDKLILVGNVEFLKKVKGGGLVPHLVDYVGKKKGVCITLTMDEVGLQRKGCKK